MNDNNTPNMNNNLQVDNAKNLQNADYEKIAYDALNIVDDLVMKNYLTKLSNYEVQENKPQDKEGIAIFKINKIVYEKDEYATDKFVSVISAMTNYNANVFLIVDGDNGKTDFYLGIKSEEGSAKSPSSIADTLKSAIEGQFPGIDIDSLYTKSNGTTSQDKIIDKIKSANAVSTYVGIPAKRNSGEDYTNQNYIQGIEKFADAMRGKKYTVIVLASNLNSTAIKGLRIGYENVYSDISVLANQQVSYSSNESSSISVNQTKGQTKGINRSVSMSESKSEGNSETEENAAGKVARFCQMAGGAFAGVGGTQTFAGGRKSTTFAPSFRGFSLGCLSWTAAAAVSPLVYVGGALQLSGAVAALGAKTLTKTTTRTATIAESEGESETESISLGKGVTKSHGDSTNLTLSMQNKHIQEVLRKIDRQLERIDVCESNGLWATCSYFISYDSDRATAETAAAIFRSIMHGEQSGVEVSAINSWNKSYEKEKELEKIRNYISNFAHPVFNYPIPNSVASQEENGVLPISFISSYELAMLIGLPRKSVPGFPVAEHISLGQEVVRWNESKDKYVDMGCIHNVGISYKGTKVPLTLNSLCQHTFITGSTGCGKSNATFHLLKNIKNENKDCHILIIEPAKGEYKKAFSDFKVFGTNPQESDLLRINPFSFPPKKIHVLDHVDRLLEIFKVCWPLYAAMPAVLKDAILKSYEVCGWDLYKSENIHKEILQGKNIYPTFSDLLLQLDAVISGSEYSEEVKSNYRGSLLTRVETLCNGINKYIFCSDENGGDETLFDDDVIVDLSSVGSLESTSLIMGLLVIKLSEYRRSKAKKFNEDLKHITVLEEAHNILKSSSSINNPEGSNISAKSVEILSKAIAEMRTYGEGFIIVDQSPGAVDLSAIRNTNTKIIMQLPEESDRRIAGKSAAMEDNQLSIIAKLPRGIAVVYQNDWGSPVLCEIPLCAQNENEGTNSSRNVESPNDRTIQETIKFLLHKIVKSNLEYDVSEIEKGIMSASWPSSTKIFVLNAIKDYEDKKYRIWDNYNFYALSCHVCEIICSKFDLKRKLDSCHSVIAIDISLTEYINRHHMELPKDAFMQLQYLLLRAYVGYDKYKLHLLEEWKTMKLKENN